MARAFGDVAYHPPDLDITGLRILRDLFGIVGGPGWYALAAIDKTSAMGILGTDGMIDPTNGVAFFRSMRGLIDLRRTTEPHPLLRGVGRGARRVTDGGWEFRLTETAFYVLEQADAVSR